MATFITRHLSWDGPCKCVDLLGPLHLMVHSSHRIEGEKPVTETHETHDDARVYVAETVVESAFSLVYTPRNPDGTATIDLGDRKPR